jgi:hypothetical protein
MVIVVLAQGAACYFLIFYFLLLRAGIAQSV